MLTRGLPRANRRVLVVIALVVLGAHALLLGGLGSGHGGRPGETVAVVQVREVVATTTAATAAVEPILATTAAPPPATPAVAPVVAPATRARMAAVPKPLAVPAGGAGDAGIDRAAVAAVGPASAAPASDAAGPGSIDAEGGRLEPMPDAVDPVATAQAAVASTDIAPDAIKATAAELADAEAPPPTYPARLPPAATLRYDLERGALSGIGELHWQPQGGAYALRLDGTVVGIPVLMQASAGGIAGTGLEPQRFTDRRVRRPMLAANFDRAARRVTFSGPSTQVPLHPGAQDRLSWMVQLAGIAAADPARREPGARTVLQVVGARGDSAVWSFRSTGPETIRTRAGPLPTVHLVREARGPYDTGVEVWLDPQRHFLPVRATMRNGDDGEVFELKLKEFNLGG